MDIIAYILFILFALRSMYNLGRIKGREEGAARIGAHFPDQVRTFKAIADDLLRQGPQQAELHIHLGNEVVDCTSTMETAQFSQALKGVLDWFKPMEEAHQEK